MGIYRFCYNRNLRARALSSGLFLGTIFAFTVAAGEPAAELKSRPIQGKVVFTLNGEYENPVFSEDGKQLLVSRRTKLAGVDDEGKPREFDVDEIWRIDLSNGKKQPLIRKHEFKGRIGSQALLGHPELEDPRHLRLEFRDAEIGILRYTIDLNRFIYKRWYKNSDSAPGHDEPRLSPEEERAKPALDQCFPDEDLWSLFVIPGISGYIVRAGGGPNGEPVILRCDLHTHKQSIAFSLPHDADVDLEGGARANGRVLLGVRQTHRLKFFTGDYKTRELEPAAEIAEPADYFVMSPLPHDPGTIVIARSINWKVIESNLYQFDGLTLIRITGLTGSKSADISPDGKQLAVALHDDQGDRIVVYQLQTH